ncbi:MAG: tetraacyldisaccharide 4'-kinase [Bacteroidetes bacterium]|nr:tetraacyldisaccharide 4'-kinase [Bacteroidota bacterium]
MTRILQVILLPVSLLYGLAMLFRNLLFDLHILPSKTFGTPVISVGNLTFGGTGKTPHIEYLIRLLTPGMFLATLSRGYGRKTNGFILASKRSNVKYIGDEPLQFLKKFETVKVAVDEKRSRGIQLLLEKYPDLDVILLDDAFQHRYVKPGLSILLTDYHRLYAEDLVLPSGTLREFSSGAARADIIVVTKTPKIFSPITRRRIIEELKPKSHQRVYFSYIKYVEPVPVFDSPDLLFPARATNIFLFTGIANDYPLREHLERICSELVVMKFADHHPYNVKDIEEITRRFNDLPTQKKIIVTTEKDVMRLKTPELSAYLKNLPLFCVPMEIDFHGTDKEKFDNEILRYVKQNQRNSRIP